MVATLSLIQVLLLIQELLSNQANYILKKAAYISGFFLSPYSTKTETLLFELENDFLLL